MALAAHIDQQTMYFGSSPSCVEALLPPFSFIWLSKDMRLQYTYTICEQRDLCLLVLGKR